jgi:hypothetical protein
MNRMTSGLMVTGFSLVATLANPAHAQTSANTRPSEPVATAKPNEVAGKPDLYARLWKPLTVDIKESSLASVMEFFTQATGVALDVMWIDGKNNVGLAKESQITLKADRVPAVTLLERILEKAASDAATSSGTGGNTWQLSEEGVLEVGPKERLNSRKRTEMYDINDLLVEIHDFNGAPTFDLSQTTQDGAGSSQSPFQGGGNTGNNQTGKSLEERGQELIKIVTDTVESEQWQDNGGNGASIKFWRGSLIINAPEYVHRQIDGDGKGASTTLKLRTDSSPPSIVKLPGVPGSVQVAQTPALAETPAPTATQK